MPKHKNSEKSSNLFNFGGNFPCLICGKGDECEMSGVPLLFGEGAKTSADKCIAVEDQTDAWNQAESFGKQIQNILNNH